MWRAKGAQCRRASEEKCWEIIFSGLTAFGMLAIAALAIWGDWIRTRLFRGELSRDV
jgi:hypothetical protein